MFYKYLNICSPILTKKVYHILLKDFKRVMKSTWCFIHVRVGPNEERQRVSLVIKGISPVNHFWGRVLHIGNTFSSLGSRGRGYPVQRRGPCSLNLWLGKAVCEKAGGGSSSKEKNIEERKKSGIRCRGEKEQSFRGRWKATQMAMASQENYCACFNIE